MEIGHSIPALALIACLKGVRIGPMVCLSAMRVGLVLLGVGLGVGAQQIPPTTWWKVERPMCG